MMQNILSMMQYDVPIYIGMLALLINIHRIQFNPIRSKHFINFGILEEPKCSPLTVSEAQSCSILRRNSLTFIWCMLGFTLTYKRLFLYQDTIEFIHYSLPLLSIFPLKANVKEELVLFIEIDSIVCNYIHYIIVFTYISLYPFYNIIWRNSLSNIMIIILSIILYILIHVKHKHTLIIEAYIICIITLIFTHCE